jgi:hypothetical protein
MAEKVIAYRVKVVNEGGAVVEQTATTFKELKKSVADLEKELENTDFGSEQFKDLNKELKNSKGALSEATSSTMSLSEKLGSIGGPIGGAIQGVMGLGKAFTALVMNPIGAVIAALGLIFMAVKKAMESTEEGGFKLAQAFAAISGILDPVIKLVGQLGVVLIDGVLKGLEAVQKGLEFLGFDALADASRDAEALAESTNKVEEAEGDLAVARAEQNKQLAEAREIISDTNVSLEDRQKALQDVKKSEESLASREVELAKTRLANAQENLRLKGESKEALDAEEAALIALSNTEQNQAAVRRKNIKAEQALQREGEAAEKEAAEARKKRSEDRIKNAEAVAKVEQDLNLALILDENEKLLKVAELNFNAQIAEIDALKTTEAKKKELRLLAIKEFGLEKDKLDAAANQKAIDAQKVIDDKAKADAQLAYDLEVRRIQALIALDQMKYDEGQVMGEEDLQNTINLQKQLTDQLLTNDKLTAEERLLIQEQFNQFSGKLTRQRNQDELDAERLKLVAIAGLLGQFAELAGEQSIFGKAAAVAQATINTYLGATAAYTNALAVPGIGLTLAPIAAGLAVAAGLKSVQKILFTEVPETPKFAMGGIVGGYGYGTEDNITARVSSGEAIMSAGAVDLFSPILSLMNVAGGGKSFSGGMVSTGADAAQLELINSVKRGNQTPVQAYVVSTQMENQMMLSRATKSRSLI